MDKINKLIWKLPPWVHDLILLVTGWRLVKRQFWKHNEQYCYSLSGVKWEVSGYIKEKDSVLEWHKKYPL